MLAVGVYNQWYFPKGYSCTSISCLTLRKQLQRFRLRCRIRTFFDKKRLSLWSTTLLAQIHKNISTYTFIKKADRFDYKLLECTFFARCLLLLRGGDTGEGEGGTDKQRETEGGESEIWKRVLDYETARIERTLHTVLIFTNIYIFFLQNSRKFNDMKIIQR